MLLRSYYAASVETAISQARRELGEDAMLVDSRPAGLQARHLGAYEVVFAIEPPAQPRESKPAASGVERRGSEPVWEHSVEQLRRELRQVRDEVSRTGSFSSSTGLFADPLLAIVHSELLARDFSPEFARDLAASVDASGGRTLGKQDRLNYLRDAIGAELRVRIPVNGGEPATGNDAPGTQRARVMAVFGPPGSGKTTSLVKLAIRFGVGRRRAVRVVSLDNLRIGAAEQLRSYCSILGASFQQLDTPSQIGTVLGEARGRPLVLIDTPGMGPGEIDLIAELGRCLVGQVEVERNLVLPAVAKASDLRLMADRFACCAPHYLTITHLDEAGCTGGIVSVAVAAKLPIAYLCNGQQIPDDLDTATADKVAELAWDRCEAGRGKDSGRQAGSAAAGLG